MDKDCNHTVKKQSRFRFSFSELICFFGNGLECGEFQFLHLKSNIKRQNQAQETQLQGKDKDIVQISSFQMLKMKIHVCSALGYSSLLQRLPGKHKVLS